MSELRKDPIVDRWVIIATERSRRPSDFNSTEIEPPAGAFCPFCPDNESRTPPELAQWGRPTDAPPNSKGWQVRVVPNKFPVLKNEGEPDPQGLGMFDFMNGIGSHEVIIENPRHDWDFAGATPMEMREILGAYTSRLHELRRDERLRYTVIFRNSGTVAGATLAHPHSQVIALPIIPKQVKEQLDAAHEYYDRKSRCVFCDVIRQELSMKDRVVEANEHFVVLSPFAARFPFELQIYPRRHSHDFTLMTADEMDALGATLARNLCRLKRTLDDPPYNFMLQTAPSLHSRPGRPEAWGTIAHDYHWRIDILPRLTRVAGFEWGTGFYINPVAPEHATQLLQEVEV
jgi:UDPglucose--hexose-1-phosphate uridylyltransferase